jgi:hypothetical protein
MHERPKEAIFGNTLCWPMPATSSECVRRIVHQPRAWDGAEKRDARLEWEGSQCYQTASKTYRFCHWSQNSLRVIIPLGPTHWQLTATYSQVARFTSSAKDRNIEADIVDDGSDSDELLILRNFVIHPYMIIKFRLLISVRNSGIDSVPLSAALGVYL